jgi:malate permease and related proteins
MSQLWNVTQLVIAVYLVVGAGMLARGLGWLKLEADASFTKVTAFVLIPCLFFSKIIGNESFASFRDVLSPIAVGFGTTVLGFAVAGLLAWSMKRQLVLPELSQRRAFTLTAGMYNYGYIPLPLCKALYATAVPTMLVHNVGVEIALWTVGILIISGSLDRDFWKHLLNPPAIAIALAVAINGLGWSGHVPKIVLDATRDLGLCAIPIGLVISGAVMLDLLREMKLSEGKRMLAGAIAIRMMLLPAAFLALAKFLPVSTELKQVILLQAAMPAAMFPIVVTRLYKQDTETSVRIVVATSLLGLLTIPLWIWAGQKVLFGW